MSFATLSEALVRHRDGITDLLRRHRATVTCPVYASVDVRTNADKAAVVDANAFPAGFNNLTLASRASASDALRRLLGRTQPTARSVLLLAENHSRNAAYAQHLEALHGTLAGAGFAVSVGRLDASEAGDGPAGVERREGRLWVNGAAPDLVILNNDLSSGLPPELVGLQQPVLPPPGMGWFARRKSLHFDIAAQIASQVARVAGVDDWLMRAHHRSVTGLDFRASEGLAELATQVDGLLADVQGKYDAHGIREAPHAFVKADPGTYGMGILVVQSGEDVRELNSRDRQKMDRGKGKRKTDRVLVQEGVPTTLRVPLDGRSEVAEPVLYMVCGRVVGGFHRSHATRSDRENLNSPGARFGPFAMDSRVPGSSGLDEGTETVYRFLAEIASIATAYEERRTTEPGFPVAALA